MRQRLVCAAHNSEADVLISAFHKGRDDGVERAFVWREYIGRIGIQRKQRTTILQHESHAFHRDAGAKALVIALNQRHDIAVAIDRGQVCRVASRSPVCNVTIRPIGIDQFRPFFCIFFREQTCHRDLREPGISVVPFEIRIRQFHSFNFLVEFGNAERPAGRGWGGFHDVQHLECRHALPVRRQLINSPVAISS